MTNEEIALIENIIRSAKKGKSINFTYYNASYLIDTFQHIEDEAMRLLPEYHRFKNERS